MLVIFLKRCSTMYKCLLIISLNYAILGIRLSCQGLSPQLNLILYSFSPRSLKTKLLSYKIKRVVHEGLIKQIMEEHLSCCICYVHWLLYIPYSKWCLEWQWRYDITPLRGNLTFHSHTTCRPCLVSHKSGSFLCLY